MFRSITSRPATMRKLTTGLLAGSLLTLSGLSQADWTLDNAGSQLNFISVKKSAVAEVHSFKTLSGSLSDKGDAKLSIDLSSVATNIPIRDERMQSLLFDTANFPNAELSAKVDLKEFSSLSAGESTTADIQLNLNLHGQTQTVPATVRVTALANGGLQVTTLAPVVINAADFELVAGINKLKEVAGLPSISVAVPVTATLVFER